jgi:hypothetical protein
MQVKNITIVVRGTKGEIMRGVFDADGNCLSGDERVLSALTHTEPKAEDEQTDDVTDAGSDDNGAGDTDYGSSDDDTSTGE